MGEAHRSTTDLRRSASERGLGDGLPSAMGTLRKRTILLGAGDETRTRDIFLGKEVLYQLSYTRFSGAAGGDSPPGWRSGSKTSGKLFRCKKFSFRAKSARSAPRAHSFSYAAPCPTGDAIVKNMVIVGLDIGAGDLRKDSALQQAPGFSVTVFHGGAGAETGRQGHNAAITQGQ